MSVSKTDAVLCETRKPPMRKYSVDYHDGKDSHQDIESHREGADQREQAHDGIESIDHACIQKSPVV